MILEIINNYSNVLVLALLVVVLLVAAAIYFKIKKTQENELGAKDVDRNFREELSKKIEETALKRLGEITKESSVRIEESVKMFSEEMAKLAQQKSLEIGAFIEKQQQEQVKESQFFVANSLSRVENDVAEYKKNKMAKIDLEIRQIVLSAAREVIGRAISLSEHEDLVSKSLERAKKDQIFT